MQLYVLIGLFPSFDSMTFAVKLSYHMPFSKQSQQLKRDRPFCTDCKIQSHTLKICFKAGNAQAPTCSHCHMTGHIAE